MTPATNDDEGTGRQSPPVGPLRGVGRLPVSGDEALSRGYRDSSTVEHVSTHTAHLQLALQYWQRQFEIRMQAEQEYQSARLELRERALKQEARAGLFVGIFIGTLFARVATDSFKTFLGVSPAVWEAVALVILLLAGSASIYCLGGLARAWIRLLKLEPNLPAVATVEEIVDLMGQPINPPSPDRPDLD